MYLSDDKILYSCNRGNLKNHIQVEIGQIDFKLNKTHHSQILSYDESNLRALLGLAALSEKDRNYKEMLAWINRAREKNPNP